MKANKIGLFSLLACSLALASCIKDEPLNMECDIEEAVVHLVNPTSVFYSVADTAAMITRDYASDDIVFSNVQVDADLSAMAPEFTITKGATITPASGTVRDFSNGPQQYVVTSEDGRHHRIYNVRFAQPKHFYSYNFENYFLDKYGKYYIWSDMPDGETPNWCSANAGFGIARSNATPEEYPTTPDVNGYEGACVKLTTCSTGSWGNLTNKRLAAGNLFLGTFDLSKAVTKTLQSTLFGIPTARKPLRFTGYYKYQPGERMQNKDGEFIDGTDTGAIYAVVYKNHDAEGNKVVLTGEDIMSNPLRVGMAKLYDIKNTNEWTAFNVEFDYWEDIDPEVLASLGYNMVVVCSSSKDGDLYQGAIGSTMWVDKMTVVVE